MKEVEARGGAGFKVVCAWCGAVIRPSAVKDSERTCAECFRRMLDRCLRRKQSRHTPEASQR